VILVIYVRVSSKENVSTEVHWSPLYTWVECNVCFFYYRSLTLVRAGVDERS